jgi:hypothetical protein
MRANKAFLRMLTFVFILLPCLHTFSVASQQSGKEKIFESYDTILLDEQMVDIDMYSHSDVVQAVLKTLEDLTYEVYRLNEEEGIVISRIYRSRMRTYRSSGSDNVGMSSSPAEGHKYFLIFKTTVNEDGKSLLQCMIAKPLKDWNDRIAEKVLNQVVLKLKSNLYK